MTPKELKNSILQYAIQGKLVEQRPEEGTGKELYQQIQAEKQQLKIKDNKKVVPIDEENLPFDIPDNWKWVAFGDIADYRMGKTPPRAESEWWNADIPWVSITDMPESGHISCTKEKVSQIALSEKFGGILSKAGTLLMSFKLTVGRVSILDIDAVHNEAIISIFPFCNNEGTIQNYLFEILPLITQFGESKNAIKGKTLNATSISNLLIPLPPLAEQKRIVAKIEELLPLVDRYEAAWNKLEALNKRFPDDMQKSILQQAIQGKLVEQCPEEGTAEELYQLIQAEKQKLIKEKKIKKSKPLPEITEEEKPFEIPESWKWVKFGEVITLLSGTDFKPDEYNDQGIGIPYITGASSLSEDGVIVNRWTESPRIIATYGDVLLVCKGSGYGKTVICDIDEAHIARQIMAVKEFACLNMLFIKYYLKANIKNIKAKGQGVIPGIDRGSVLNMVFPLPPLAEQKRIVAKIEELLPLCERLK